MFSVYGFGACVTFWHVDADERLTFGTFQRNDIPASLTQATSTSGIDISTWGPPSASYPSATCNISQFFTPQQLVIDITLCGDWYDIFYTTEQPQLTNSPPSRAGVPSIYGPACGHSGSTGLCVRPP